MWLGSHIVWLWRRPAAIALIRPLAQERPYAKVDQKKKERSNVLNGNARTFIKKEKKNVIVFPLHHTSDHSWKKK